MINNNKFIIWLLAFFITGMANARGSSDTPPPSCAYPCTSSPLVVCCPPPCSSCPEIKTNDDIAGKVMKTYESLGGYVKDSFEKTMDTVDHIMWAFTGMFVLISGIFGVWGVKSILDVKKDIDTAKEELTEEAASIKTQLETVKNEATEKFETIQNNSITNAESLALAVTANLIVIAYIIHRQEDADAATKAKFDSSLEVAFQSINEAIEKHNPSDTMIMAFALSIRGTIFHLRKQYQLALDDFETSNELRPDKASTLFNAACSACKSGDTEKALKYVKQAIIANSARREEALYEDDLKSIWEEIKKIT